MSDFEHFDSQLRAVLALAQSEAERQRNPEIRSEHLLFGLLFSGENSVGNVLIGLQVELDPLYSNAEQLLTSLQDVSDSDPQMGEEAKAILRFAVEEAGTRGEVGTVHLLLGLLSQESAAAALLRSSGVTLEAVRVAIEARDASFEDVDSLPPTDSDPALVGWVLPLGDRIELFTGRVRTVFQLADEEAHRFSHPHIGTEHLLLGLIREGDGVASSVLATLDVDLDDVRSSVEAIVVSGESVTSANERKLTSHANRALELTFDEARRLNQAYVGTEHLLLGLVREGEGIAAGVLETRGVTLEKVRSQVHQLETSNKPSGIQAKPAGDEPPDSNQPEPTLKSAPPGKGTFSKFTERSRKVLTLAQEESKRFNHDYIGTEHLLLGMVREGDGVAARTLRNFGVTLPKVRSAVEFIIGRGELAIEGEVDLTPRAKKVLELAIDEGRSLHHPYIGTEHLLLGLIREGGGIGAGVLESLGIELEAVRTQVFAGVSQSAAGTSPDLIPDPLDSPPPSPSDPTSAGGARLSTDDILGRFTERANRVLALSQEEAQRFNHNYIGTEHLLLGLVREGNGVAARVLNSMGVQLPKVRSAVEFIIGRGEAVPVGEISLTPRAKQVLKLAVDEGKRLKNDHVGTEHLLLGLVREGEGIAAGVLESLGVNLENVRQATTRATLDPEVLAQEQAEEELRREWERIDSRLLAGVNWRGVKLAIDRESAQPIAETAAGEPAGLVLLAEQLELSLTNQSHTALNNASKWASRAKSDSVRSEHVLGGLAQLRTGGASRLLSEFRFSGEAAESRANRMISWQPDLAGAHWDAREFLIRAGQERPDDTTPVNSIQLLMALLRDESALATRIATFLKIPVTDVLASLELLLAPGPDSSDSPEEPDQTGEQ